MPTYEYRCDACGHAMEEFQSITAKPLRKCPKCGKSKLKRLIGTGAGIIFKGGGFWQTDYRSEGYKAAAKADSEASKPAAETKSETKSDTKADTAAKSESPAKPEPAPAKSESPKPAAKGGKKKGG